MNFHNVYKSFFKLAPNCRGYDHLRCQSDTVSRYTKLPQITLKYDW